MKLVAVFVLGIIQGVAEFLPVSSSGHLVIFQKILGFSEPPIFFDIVLHLGTLMAVLIFFKKKFFKLTFKFFPFIMISLLPTILFGFFLNSFAKTLFNSFLVVGGGLLTTSLLVFSTFLVKKNFKKLNHLTFFDALLIGIFQAIAIFPGISRSGATITAGIWRKIKKEEAFDFSFLIGAPAMVGALLIKIPEVFSSPQKINFYELLVGFLTSLFFGFVSLKILKKTILGEKFFYFGFYCLVLGIICFWQFFKIGNS